MFTALELISWIRVILYDQWFRGRIRKF